MIKQVLMGCALVFPFAAHAQAPRCAAEQSAVKDIGTKYKSQFDEIDNEGKDIEDDTKVAVKVDVDWKDVEIILDVPAVKLRDERLVFGAPQVTMRLNEIIFHTPSSRMVPKKIGQYPEFTCSGFSCTTRWSDIITHVPETFMEEQRIKLDVPEFKWADTEIIMGIPEVSMERQRWVLGLPQFKVTSVTLDPGGFEERGKNLQRKAEALKEKQVEDMGGAVNSLYGCYRDHVLGDREQAALTFDSAIAQVESTIKLLQDRKGDPSNTTGSDGKSTDFIAKREELVAKKKDAMQKFDEAIAKLNTKERGSLK
jgi:hypothetical protein